MVQLFIKKYLNSLLKLGQLIALVFPVFIWAQFPSAKDCNTAYRICDATQSYYFEADTNPGIVDDSYLITIGAVTAPTVYCVSGYIYPTPEWHPAWFVFTPQYSGEFGFLFCPDDATVDWQWALFESPVCGNLSDVSHHMRCDTGSPLAVVQGCTGIGFKNGFLGGANGLQAYVNITAGNTYVLYCSVLQWQLTAPQFATLSFQGAVVTAHPDLFNIPGCTMSSESFATITATVFPNPFTNSLQIDSGTTFKSMVLYDVLGKQILNLPFANSLNTTNLEQGLYLLHLITEDGEVLVKKVVKE